MDNIKMSDDINVLKSEIEILKSQLTIVTCEKVALDKAYSDQLQITYRARVQIEVLDAERIRINSLYEQIIKEKKLLEDELSTLRNTFEDRVKAKLI